MRDYQNNTGNTLRQTETYKRDKHIKIWTVETQRGTKRGGVTEGGTMVNLKEDEKTRQGT